MSRWRPRTIALAAILLASVTAGVTVLIGSTYPPSDQSATGPTCRLLPAHQVDQALRMGHFPDYPTSGVGAREERPIYYKGTPAHACGYFGDQLFGRAGFEYARLYVAHFTAVVSAERVTRSFADAWFAPLEPERIDYTYSLERPSRVGDESWACIAPPSPRTYLCLAADRKSDQGLAVVMVFISGKLQILNTSPYVSLAQSVLAQTYRHRE